IAKLLEGLSVGEFIRIVCDMPLTEGAVELVDGLREGGFVTGIISDSYTIATGILAEKLGMDFHVANELMVDEGVLLGSLRMPMGWERIGCDCRQSVCKRYQLSEAATIYGV